MLGRILILVLCALHAGCTSAQLRYSTVVQIKTLTDLHHQIVLNNLAAFSCNPDFIPAHANLASGATQIVDQASGSSQVLNSQFNSLFATLGLTRGVVNQWATVPVTDEMTLRLLRVTYRRSLGWDDNLYCDDLANRLAHRLKSQLVVTGDVGISNALMYARGPSLPQLLDRAGWNGDDRVGFKANDPAVKLWRKDNNDIISLNSDRIIQVGEVLKEENLCVTPVLLNGVPYDAQGEMNPRVKVATPYAAEIRRQVYGLNRYLIETRSGWLGTGSKREVPRCACYVGNYKSSYVWVLPDDVADFEDFTLRILRIATLLQQPTASTTGVTFTPIQTR